MKDEMKSLLNILNEIQYEVDFELATRNEKIAFFDISGITVYKKHAFRYHDYIKSYQYKKRLFQEYWISLKIEFRKENWEIFDSVIDESLKNNIRSGICCSKSISLNNNSIISFPFKDKRIDIHYNSSDPTIEIIKFLI